MLSVGDSNRWEGIAETVGNGQVSVRLADGTTVRSPGQADKGTRVEVFVRPEAMRIGPGEDGATLAGTVDSLLFNGANSRVLLRTTGGALVEVADPAADAREGTQVQVSWPAQEALCFPQAAA